MASTRESKAANRANTLNLGSNTNKYKSINNFAREVEIEQQTSLIHKPRHPLSMNSNMQPRVTAAYEKKNKQYTHGFRFLSPKEIKNAMEMGGRTPSMIQKEQDFIDNEIVGELPPIQPVRLPIIDPELQTLYTTVSESPAIWHLMKMAITPKKFSKYQENGGKLSEISWVRTVFNKALAANLPGVDPAGKMVLWRLVNNGGEIEDGGTGETKGGRRKRRKTHKRKTHKRKTHKRKRRKRKRRKRKTYKRKTPKRKRHQKTRRKKGGFAM